MRRVYSLVVRGFEEVVFVTGCVFARYKNCVAKEKISKLFQRAAEKLNVCIFEGVVICCLLVLLLRTPPMLGVR